MTGAHAIGMGEHGAEHDHVTQHREARERGDCKDNGEFDAYDGLQAATADVSEVLKLRRGSLGEGSMLR